MLPHLMAVQEFLTNWKLVQRKRVLQSRIHNVRHNLSHFNNEAQLIFKLNIFKSQHNFTVELREKSAHVKIIFETTESLKLSEVVIHGNYLLNKALEVLQDNEINCTVLE